MKLKVGGLWLWDVKWKDSCGREQSETIQILTRRYSPEQAVAKAVRWLRKNRDEDARLYSIRSAGTIDA